MPVRVVCCCDEGELIDAESTRAEKSLGRKGVLKERAMTQLSQLAAALLVAALIFLIIGLALVFFFFFFFFFFLATVLLPGERTAKDELEPGTYADVQRQ